MPKSSGSASSSTQRLPVNHRRHKVAPEQRKRVPTACNNCNVRRIKCSGERPCVQCRNSSRNCQYPVVVEKISIPRTELDDLRAKCARLEQCLEQIVPDEARRQALVAQMGSGSGGSSSTSGSSATLDLSDVPEDETAPNEGRLLSDPDGTARYLGSTSGATFLDLVKEFMTTLFPLAWPDAHNSQPPEITFLGSLGHYQTYDSRPLVMQHADPFCLPMKTDMAVMMAQLRYFIQDGSGDFASGGIYYWGDLDSCIYDGTEPLESSTSTRALRRLALFQAAFAMTCQLETPGESNNRTQRSEVFFARARLLMGNPLDTTTTSVYDIPVLAMMAIYLVEVNRRDAAYMYVSLGIHIAIMHGIHRGWAPDEQGKRSFWTLYILDRWLSVLMGRPPALLDDAIKLPLPQDVRGLPPAAGLRAHLELAKISGYIVCNTYRVAPWEHRMASTSDRIDTALSWLSNWLLKLPVELQLNDDQPSKDRACCELHVSYNQLLILTVRPIFFVAVKKAVAERFINRTWSLESHPQIAQIRQCSEAARKNLRLGRYIRELTPSRKLLASLLHSIFNAAVILILYQLLVDTLDDNDAMDIIFVVECFDAEAHGENNYHRDCARVLRDMTTLVQRLRNRNLDGFAQSGESPSIIPAPSATPYDVSFVLNPEEPPNIPVPMIHQLPVTTGPLYNELSTWIDHDALQLYTHYLCDKPLGMAHR